MKGRPFNDHRRRTIRKIPFQENDRLNPNLCLIPTIDGMEVRWIMIVELHTNHDAEKTADFWHLPPSYNDLSSEVSYIRTAGSYSSHGPNSYLA